MTVIPPLPVETLEQIARRLLASEQFGVLATAVDGHLHTATILFAETPDWELVHVIRPATLKAQMSAASPRVAFQVDNRGTVATDRTAFTRLSFEGTLRRVPREDPDWQRYHDVFAAKFPFGATLLRSPEVDIYVLTPERVRIAVGAHPPVDIAIPPPRRVYSESPA
jgi:hypothetical protein